MNDILSNLRSSLAAALPTDTFKLVIIGKVALPAEADLPMLCIYPLGTSQARSGTLRDNAVFRIGIEVIVSLKKYLDSTNAQGTKLDTLEALVDFVEDRDANGTAEADTVIGILNANLTAGGKTLYTDAIEVTYDPYLNSGGFPYARATITFEAYDRPNRTT